MTGMHVRYALLYGSVVNWINAILMQIAAAHVLNPLNHKRETPPHESNIRFTVF